MKNTSKIISLLLIYIVVFVSIIPLNITNVNASYCPPKNVSISYVTRYPKTYGSSFGANINLTTKFKYLNRCGRKDYASPAVVGYGWGTDRGYSVVRDYGTHGYASRYFKVGGYSIPYYKIRVTHYGNYTGTWSAKNHETLGRWY